MYARQFWPENRHRGRARRQSNSAKGLSLHMRTMNSLSAAWVADMAITDMSDNVNKMGTDISSIQNVNDKMQMYRKIITA